METVYKDTNFFILLIFSQIFFLTCWFYWPHWQSQLSTAKCQMLWRLIFDLWRLRLFLILEQDVISFAGSKEITKEKSFSRCTKFPKNQRLSLNFGNSSLRSSDSPKFFTFVPRFYIRKFHDAGELVWLWNPHPLLPVYRNVICPEMG